MNIWAHRGLSYKYPENTLTAFRAACAYDITGIELDIQKTKDGEIVVIHDEKVDRTTDGTGFVKDFTLKELKQLKIANGEGEPERIPTMREVLELLKPYCLGDDLLINIEMKNSEIRYKGMEEEILRLVAEFGLSDHIVYSSFLPEAVALIKELDPTVRTGILHDSPDQCVAWLEQTKADAIHPFVQEVVPGQHLERLGLPVRAWNIRNQEPFFGEEGTVVRQDTEKLRRMGVTDLFTNNADLYCELHAPRFRDTMRLIPGVAPDPQTGLLTEKEGVAANAEPAEVRAGMRMRWNAPHLEYRIHRYSGEIDPALIYTYTYHPESNWTTICPEKETEDWTDADTTFEDDGYIRLEVRRKDGQEMAEGIRLKDICTFSGSPDHLPPIPSYFLQEIQETERTVRACRGRGDRAYLLLADSHYATGGHWEETLRNLKAVSRRICPDGVIHLGDFTDGLMPSEQTGEWFLEVKKDLLSLGCPLRICVGNHDTNSFRNNPDPFTREEWETLYLDGKKNSFTDDARTKVRSIFLSSFDPKEKERYGFDAGTVVWFAKTLLTTPIGWRLLIFSHVPPLPEIHYWSKEIRNGLAMVRLAQTANRLGHPVLGWFHGHNHADQIYRRKGFPIISIGCVKMEDFKDKKPNGAFVPDRKAGDVTQELWDVLVVHGSGNSLDLIRFGAGTDRKT